MNLHTCLPGLLAALLCSGWAAESATNDPSALSQFKTFSTIGKEQTVLTTNTEAELFRHAGRGCLTHMWFGGDWPGYERTRIRVYVDDEAQAGIEMELGLGHGIGFGDATAPWGTGRIGKTGHPSGIYNTYRSPFGKSIRVTGQLGEGVKTPSPFWWIIRGTENLRAEIAGVPLPEGARLRLYKRETFRAKPLEEFALCDLGGAGAVYQITIAARAEKKASEGGSLGFLEACMRAYVNGASEPMFLSSGLEDYFLGTYYFNRGLYHTSVAGLTHIDRNDNSFSAYRFHDDDPLFFQSGMRLTCRCGEKLGDKSFGTPPATDYTTYCWVYQW